MAKENRIALTQMQSDQRGVVVDIEGGRGLIDRLIALGVVPGKTITKISNIAD